MLRRRQRDAVGRRLSPDQAQKARRLVRIWRVETTNSPLDAATVRFVQFALTELAYRPGSVDGLLGPRTRRALRAYQKELGLKEDGEVSAELLRRLRADRLAR